MNGRQRVVKGAERKERRVRLIAGARACCICDCVCVCACMHVCVKGRERNV